MIENSMILPGSDHPAYQPEGFECTECEGEGVIIELDEDGVEVDRATCTTCDGTGEQPEFEPDHDDYDE